MRASEARRGLPEVERHVLIVVAQAAQSAFGLRDFLRLTALRAHLGRYAADVVDAIVRAHHAFLLVVADEAALTIRQADAPLAFGRRKCSSSRGMISTKLQGRVR